jgi:hypothetical protein
VNVKVTASDPGGLFASDTFDVTVANTNDAPVLVNAIPDRPALVGCGLQLCGAGKCVLPTSTRELS